MEREFSNVNELRYIFWKAYRELRNKFKKDFPHKNYQFDADWQKFNDLLNDMYKSCVHEDLRRQIGPPRRERPMKLRDGPVSFRSKPVKSGLYANDKLCEVCRRPLSGKQRSFCSESCRGINKSRRFRRDFPDKKAKSNLEYLKATIDNDE